MAREKIWDKNMELFLIIGCRLLQVVATTCCGRWRSSIARPVSSACDLIADLSHVPVISAFDAAFRPCFLGDALVLGDFGDGGNTPLDRRAEYQRREKRKRKRSPPRHFADWQKASSASIRDVAPRCEGGDWSVCISRALKKNPREITALSGRLTRHLCVVRVL